MALVEKPVEVVEAALARPLVEGPGGRTLLTGDIEAPGEAALLAERARLATDLLVAPHHGSRTSSTALTSPSGQAVPAG